LIMGARYREAQANRLGPVRGVEEKDEALSLIRHGHSSIS